MRATRHPPRGQGRWLATLEARLSALFVCDVLCATKVVRIFVRARLLRFLCSGAWSQLFLLSVSSFMCAHPCGPNGDLHDRTF